MTQNIAIIGAGLSGLIAAHALKTDYNVTLFDKSRGVGGRMSTRYAGDYEFDHGAQYFTARDPRFQAAVEDAIAQGFVAPWSGRAFYKKGFDLEPDTGSDRFVGTPRMNSWCKALAKSLDVTLGARVSGLIRKNDKWTLRFEDSASQSGFDVIICAIPSLQAMDLVPAEFSELDALKVAKMDACFALMVGWDVTHDFGWDSLRVSDSPVAWMAINSAKPDRNKAVTTLMVHADPNWSNEHAGADRFWVQSELERAAAKIIGRDPLAAPFRVLHRWLYASVSRSPQQCVLHDSTLGVAVCGDWCVGGRVEGAYLSGLAAADAIKLSV